MSCVTGRVHIRELRVVEPQQQRLRLAADAGRAMQLPAHQPRDRLHHHHPVQGQRAQPGKEPQIREAGMVICIINSQAGMVKCMINRQAGMLIFSTQGGCP